MDGLFTKRQALGTDFVMSWVTAETTAQRLQILARGKRPQVAPPLDPVRKISAPCRGAIKSVARFARFGFLGGDVVPGLRSLRSLTRG